MHHLNEKTLGSEQLVDGKLLKVYRDTVQTPSATESVREWIKHPGAAAVVPVFPDGTTILVHQFRYPPRKVFLEVPAGKIDKQGESPQEVAERELEEETGWKAGKLTPLGSFYPCVGYSSELIHFYLAEDLTEGKQHLDEGEHVEIERIPLAEAVRKVHAYEIDDMKTALALLYADAFLKNKQAGSAEGI